MRGLGEVASHRLGGSRVSKRRWKWGIHFVVTRREFVARCAGTSAVWALGIGRTTRAADVAAPPVRSITKGPSYHWFGYYDKLQFDPTDRYVLGMQIDFVDRDPRPDDAIRIGMIDLEDGDRWIDLGETRAWCWQQGCMLQWRPGSKSEILWNDREDDRWVCHVLDVFTGQKRTIEHSIYSIAPDGKTAVTVDYGRLWRLASGYGYNGVADRNKTVNVPDDDGIWRVDLESGQAKLIVSMRQVVEVGEPMQRMAESPNYLKHLLCSPDGSRFIFLQRWMPRWPRRGRYTRMLTANLDGSDIRVVDGSGNTSHFIWRDQHHILAWTRLPVRAGRTTNAPIATADDIKALAGSNEARSLFFLFDERTGDYEPVGPDVMRLNGHCTYLPGNDWILNDTYPQGSDRTQHVYLYHVPTGRQVTLGRFHSPSQYGGSWRCDTHPRFSRNGHYVVVDSPHTEDGRQMHLIDIRGIV